MKFRSEYLNGILAFERWEEIEQTTDRILQRYYPSRRAEQKSIAEVLSAVKDTIDFRRFIGIMNSVNPKHLYQSGIHGRFHTERVCLLALIISKMTHLPSAEILLVLEMAAYHDIGRINDREDEMHGLRGALMYEHLHRERDPERLSLIQAVITGHSMEDEDFKKVCARFSISSQEDLDVAKRCLNILKDADALDRFRLGSLALDPRFLRLKASKTLIGAACSLCINREVMF